MSKKKSLSTAAFLIILFALGTLVRIALAFFFRHGPTVVIDESLYTNIARSLADSGSALYRDQPVEYPYLLYPLLLAPVYRINRYLGCDIYRVIQVFNAIIMNSAVFPAYLFAKDFTKGENRARIAAVLTMLMPDMIMSSFLMCECVLWPLALWLIYFGFGMFEGKRPAAYLTALFTALMYFAKPGAIVMGAALIAVNLLTAIRKKRDLGHAIGALALTAALLGLIYALWGLVGAESGSIIGLYNKQTSDWRPLNVLIAVEAFFAMSFLFAASCGGYFALVPFANFKRYEETQKRLITAVTLGLLGIIAGTSVFVVPYQWKGGLGNLRLHMRYFSMFIPVFIVFTFGSGKLGKKEVSRFPLAVVCVYLLLLIVPSCGIGFADGTTSVDSLTLVSYVRNSRLNGAVTGTVCTAALVSFAVWMIFKFKKGRDLRDGLKTAGIFLAALMIFNSVCAVKSNDVHLESDPAVAEAVTADALEINEILNDCPNAVGVTQRYYNDINSYWLEAHLDRPLQQITFDQMCVKMQESGGIYSPFIPEDQAPISGSVQTRDADMLILGRTVAEHMELTEGTIARKTANGQFTAVTLNKGERWVDTMLYGLDDNTLKENTDSFIVICGGRGNTLEIEMTACGVGTLTVGNASFTLTDEPQTFTATVNNTSSMITVSVTDGIARILTYSTKG